MSHWVLYYLSVAILYFWFELFHCFTQWERINISPFDYLDSFSGFFGLPVYLSLLEYHAIAFGQGSCFVRAVHSRSVPDHASQHTLFIDKWQHCAKIVYLNVSTCQFFHNLFHELHQWFIMLTISVPPITTFIMNPVTEHFMRDFLVKVHIDSFGFFVLDWEGYVFGAVCFGEEGG